jgi:hypothetical protein
MASPYEPRLPPKIPDVAAIPSTQPYGGRGGVATNYGRNPKEPYVPPAQVPFYPYPPHQSGGGIPVMAGQFIPPNGLAGWMQQTPAVQNLYRSRRARPRRRASSRGMRKINMAELRRRGYTGPPPRSRRGAKKRIAAAISRARGSQKGRLVKGSAAAKRYMARIRKMRKRR